MNLEQFNAKIKERNDKIAEINKVLKKEGKDLLTQMFMPLFDKYPELQSFAWGQGQHYNDETYYFSVDTDSESIFINGEVGWDTENLPEWAEKASEEISDLLCKFQDSDMELMFGDGYKMTVTKDKIESEYYDTGY